jgi:hypothetical protein
MSAAGLLADLDSGTRNLQSRFSSASCSLLSLVYSHVSGEGGVEPVAILMNVYGRCLSC